MGVIAGGDGAPVYSKKYTLVPAATGVQFSQLNNFGIDVMVTHACVNATTKSTIAGTVDVGVATTSVSNDGLLDGLDVGTAAGVLSVLGTNGKLGVLWPVGSYLTVFRASGDPSGMVGTLQIQYTPLT